MPESKLVQSPNTNWDQMDGELPRIKRVNGYLAETLVFSHVPADECLSYAQLFDRLSSSDEVSQDDFIDLVSAKLAIMFSVATPFHEGEFADVGTFNHVSAARMKQVAAHVWRLLH